MASEPLRLLSKVRTLPAAAVALLVVALVVALAGLGYYGYVTFSSTQITGSLNTGNPEEYDWAGDDLVLQSTSDRRHSDCTVEPAGGDEFTVRVPRNSSKGFLNAPDVAEVDAASGGGTITCTRNVRIWGGSTASQGARVVNHPAYFFGLGGVVAVLAIGAIFLGVRRSRRVP